MGTPKEFEGKAVKIKEVEMKNDVKYLTVEKICKKLGWES